MAKRVTAKEMFEEFGFSYTEDKGVTKVEGYLREDIRMIIVFYDDSQSYFVDVDDGKKLAWINMAVHKAINKFVKERGWVK
jgi:molybdopterin-guanine dinucleotide biosynthesis protein